MSENHDAIIVRKQPGSILFDSFSLILDKSIKTNKPIIPYLYIICPIIIFIVLILIVLVENKYRIIHRR